MFVSHIYISANDINNQRRWLGRVVLDRTAKRNIMTVTGRYVCLVSILAPTTFCDLCACAVHVPRSAFAFICLYHRHLDRHGEAGSGIVIIDDRGVESRAANRCSIGADPRDKTIVGLHTEVPARRRTIIEQRGVRHIDRVAQVEHQESE